MSNNAFPIFHANMILRGKLECITGLHIGGNQEKLQIGGIDSPVVRHPATGMPYIPGSSLKGKMRHLLEYITGALGEPIDKIGDVSMRKDIVSIFGIGAEVKEKAATWAVAEKDGNKEKMRELEEEYKDNPAFLKRLKELNIIGLSRLIVRDAHADEATQKMWEDNLADDNFTEYKAENYVDRLTSAANPRFIERVVAGSQFNVEFVYGVYAMSNENEQDIKERADEDLSNIKMALRLLENSAIGKSGSRGYGKIKFQFHTPIWLRKEDYRKDGGKYEESMISIDKFDDKEFKGLEALQMEYIHKEDKSNNDAN